MPTLTEKISIAGEGTAPSIDDFDGFLAAATLLQRPRLARSYVYICYYGPATVQELIDTLDVARATAYDDIERLETLSLVERDESTRPHKLTAEPFAFVDQDELAITPTVLHAIALTEIDDDLEYFQNRYGTGRLVRGLRLTGEHYAGQLTQRLVAEKLDVAPAEGMAVVQALRPALAAGQEFDPYFDRLFPAIADAIDVDIDRVQPRSDRTNE
ncbi:DUF7437 domain-containing protein [Halapricum hydrolyticum]|uniref:Helix-turn-helix domain-containing protein n=1 Tax=Halapricum hydrolyticum TaxID=2979991 RepID=A0AAE3IH15_9EURY|nr:helix-turn-helix domain-containing protein [Halapricum hydrolyticum]MCU4719315.1 helix-turn-helix domain-containing protein [Halapricum hydrolyticum]MCU4728240.1 helix-turn-helix domain-containing protein [Halapricum hydrolyticum]